MASQVRVAFFVFDANCLTLIVAPPTGCPLVAFTTTNFILFPGSDCVMVMRSLTHSSCLLVAVAGFEVTSTRYTPLAKPSTLIESFTT